MTIELGEQLQGTASVTITDALGRTALSTTAQIEGDKITVDVQSLAVASIEYSIETKTKIFRGKLTIQR